MASTSTPNLLELITLFLDLCSKQRALLRDVRSLLKDYSQRFALGRHFVEPGPSYRIVPLAPHAFVVVVHRSRRGVLAFEGVLGVEAPQPSVPGHPGRRWRVQ